MGVSRYLSPQSLPALIWVSIYLPDHGEGPYNPFVGSCADDVEGCVVPQSWPQYYWNLCKHFGAECYRTGRWELLAGAIAGFFTAVITGGWRDYKTALFATALTLGCFAVLHLVRAPFISHKQINSGERAPSFWAGLFGLLIIVGMVAGVYKLGIVLLQARPAGSLNAVFTDANPGAEAEILRLHGEVDKLSNNVGRQTSVSRSPGEQKIESGLVEIGMTCSLRDVTKIPADKSFILPRVANEDYLSGKNGNTYLQPEPSVIYKRAEDESNVFFTMRYTLPSTSDLIGAPISRILNYDSLRVDAWGAEGDYFSSCRGTEITLRINGNDIYRHSESFVHNMEVGKTINMTAKIEKVNLPH